MKINKTLILLIILFLSNSVNANNFTFEDWLISFKKEALKKGISEITFDKSMKNVKFLPKVIEYDRYQPEFYEDTRTYISKRSSKKKLKTGLDFYNKNKKLIQEVDEHFKIEKELLLALMGIETNFGSYVGKMDILSSLATLSYDKRRSKFFTKELITILKLIDKEIIDYRILYGSWAGAFGNFQFMPSTIEKYAIDFNQNNLIELKNNQDSFASAANYLKKMGWKKNEPCFFRISLRSNIPDKYLNTSAKSIKNKKKLKFFKKYINDYNFTVDENLNTAIITPDAEILDNPDKINPAYIIFENYELILKRNRSLRFALAVCTLKDKIKNEI
ncbi:MAG: lytic murein transglycosylase [Pelagibacterales bacterium]|nr:lytic murein transglycosylase [Pelagibacterales bacterium]